ncbi:hypothetical protein [Clostridium sp.]|uniref:hypothetical protein n=1 Tax=Clostridium sp. TaxID=1506 RepID=UPI0025BC91E4|nr:hypothetical protein [Clostridium sp.]MCI1714360.1 hypothetical protein [Clostridium sp.]MCI1798622.1 hypothetical protein [Clostridium sp.]MCI1812647.1 hypothetical protein [Clostridium sp.]MCI1869431.1 hypothetical protein [Clostridium sp.]MCI2201916.1 hypothetical protein [Clostridium sp.]
MESIDLDKFPDIQLPRFFKVRQKFKNECIENVDVEIRQGIKPYINNLKNKRIALGIGSRGICNINIIAKTVIDCLKEIGAKPFIVPAMGSHGGATENGNANGIGVSDVITRKLFDSIDFKAMYTNCFTSNYSEPCKIKYPW